MKQTINHKTISGIGLLLFFGLFFGCERDLSDAVPAQFPSTPEVFIDGFSAGLNYAAFGGSDVTAFDVDDEVKYKGTSSMKFAIPDPDQPTGSYAGGVFFTSSGRNLTQYDALTFWAKASQPASVDLLGFGNDLGESKFQTTISDVKMTTNWKKYFIPIPDPSRLTEERGMFFYSEAPENGAGYTFWIDEVKFEKLGTLAHPRASIFNGENIERSAENGFKLPISGLGFTMNIPTGVDLTVTPAIDYFSFSTSNSEIASIDTNGVVNLLSEGSATITAALGELDADGSLKITSTGDPVLPQNKAPVPAIDSMDVISIFSDQYTDEPVDFYNGFWEFSTTQSNIVQVEDDNIIRYTDLNFVGIQFTSPTIDISALNTFHIDLWTPDETEPSSEFKILLVDLGADGAFGGNDDASHELTINNPILQKDQWISLDLPLNVFSGLTTRGNLAQIVISSGSISTVFVDNIYFYKGESMGGGEPIPPTSPAPAPQQDASTVVSIYSDSYDDVPNEGYNLYGTADFEEVIIEGNSALKYSGTPETNFQVIELGGANQIDAVAQGLTHFHFDLWFPNAVDPFSSFLMKLVDVPDGVLSEALININPSSDPAMQQGAWLQFDFSFTELEALGLSGSSNLQQIVIDLVNSGEVYVDNIYFYADEGMSGGPIHPTEPAPTPQLSASDVLSIYSDAYTDVGNEGFALYGNAIFEEVFIQDDGILNYSGTPETNFQVIELGAANQINAAGMGLTHFHFDLWFPNSVNDMSAFLLKVVDIPASGATEAQINVTPTSSPAMVQGSWIAFDLAISELQSSGLGGSMNIQQIVVDLINSGEVYIDNIYFYVDGGMSGGPVHPTEPAPTPQREASDVVSIYSDAYTNVGNEGYALYGNAMFEEMFIQDNGVLNYSGTPETNFQVIELGAANQIDAGGLGLTHFHVDLWFPNSVDNMSAFLLKVVDIPESGATEAQISITPTANPPMSQGTWLQYDISLDDLASLGLASTNNIQQIVVDLINSGEVYMDNIYFYGDEGMSGGPVLPTEPAPTPEIDSANVVSIYSDAYTNVGNEGFAQYGNAMFEEVFIQDNGTLRYSGTPETNFQVIELGAANQIDAEGLGLTHFHFDLWFPNAVDEMSAFLLKLVDIPESGATEAQISVTPVTDPAMVQGTWITFDLALSDLQALGLGGTMNIQQVVVDLINSGEVYVDNIFLYKE